MSESLQLKSAEAKRYRDALMDAAASELAFHHAPLPPNFADAYAINSALARLAPRIDLEEHLYRWATDADFLRTTSEYARARAKLSRVNLWHRATAWGCLVLKPRPFIHPDIAENENCYAIALEFLLNVVAEDPLILSYRRGPGCSCVYRQVDMMVNDHISDHSGKYNGPGEVFAFDREHYLHACILELRCDASNAAVRAGAAAGLARFMDAELDVEILRLVRESRRVHEKTRPH